jgi:hypothetical protein
LIDVIRAWDDKSPTGIRADGSLDYAASVTLRNVVGQSTVFHAGDVAGFFEVFSAESHGTLRITNDGTSLTGDDGRFFDWPWATLRAVQTSSKSLQLNLRTDGLFDFRFDEDSPRRWEELVHARLRIHYAALGLRVREFQPRVATVPLR